MQRDVVKRILEQIKSGAISDRSNIPNALLHYQYDENSMDISVKVRINRFIIVSKEPMFKYAEQPLFLFFEWLQIPEQHP